MSKTPTNYTPMGPTENFWQKAGGALKGTGIIGSIIGGGLSLLGNHINQKRAQKQAAQERQWNIEDWNRVNEYNTPQSQMQRFKDAGLNPNLIYGQGSPGLAGDIQGSTAHQAAFTGTDDILNQFYNFEKHQAGMDMISKQTQGIELDNTRKAITWLIEKDLLPENLKNQASKLAADTFVANLKANQEDAYQNWFEKQGTTAGDWTAQNEVQTKQDGIKLLQQNIQDVKNRNAAVKALTELFQEMPDNIASKAIQTATLFVLQKYMK